MKEPSFTPSFELGIFTFCCWAKLFWLNVTIAITHYHTITQSNDLQFKKRTENFTWNSHSFGLLSQWIVLSLLVLFVQPLSLFCLEIDNDLVFDWSESVLI
jgi:hypothetical protein